MHCTMLCLTRPLARIHTTHIVLPYIFSSVECIISIGSGFRKRNSDRDDPSSLDLEEGKAHPEAVM